MTSHTNKMRQLDFIVGYRLTCGQRRFAADANVIVPAFLNNDAITEIKSKVRRMKKV
jgi:hypothetical protein